MRSGHTSETSSPTTRPTIGAACRTSGWTASTSLLQADPGGVAMRTYVASRLGVAVVTLFGMSVVIFVLLRLAPGNIVDILFAAGGYVNASEREAIERELGLDKPIW